PIILMEDTGIKADGETYVTRPVSDYAAAMVRIGYHLVSSAPLGLRVSRGLYRRLARHLPAREEGERRPWPERAVIAACVGCARPFDPSVTDYCDLTKMVFQRE